MTAADGPLAPPYTNGLGGQVMWIEYYFGVNNMKHI